MKDSTFPPPPLPGSERVLPLDNPAILSEEGKLQGNCFASDEDKIVKGVKYFYRVLAPERATLSIVWSNGIWFISEIWAVSNKPVSPETKKAAIEWLLAGQRTLANKEH